jgi:hypothetical protein
LGCFISLELVSDTVTDGELCLDAISPDNRLLAYHCDARQITLPDSETGETTAIRLPAQVTGDTNLGSLCFSPKTESKIGLWADVRTETGQ